MAHVLPLVQMRFVLAPAPQSVSVAQPLVSPQVRLFARQSLPPQSMSVSFWPFMPSAQRLTGGVAVQRTTTL